ncbi:unnamed protein product, partial [marine sediment metagenome]
YSSRAWRDLNNIPTTSDYETGVLTYGIIYYKINPTPLPEIVNTKSLLIQTDGKIWTKIKENQGLTTYRLNQIGVFPALSFANVEATQTFPFQDEKWKDTGGNTYVFQGEDRDDISKNVYYPELLPVQVKLLITLDPSLIINETKNISVKDNL